MTKTARMLGGHWTTTHPQMGGPGVPSPQRTCRAVATRGHKGPSRPSPTARAPFPSLSWKARDLSDTALARGGSREPVHTFAPSLPRRCTPNTAVCTAGATTHLGPTRPSQQPPKKDAEAQQGQRPPRDTTVSGHDPPAPSSRQEQAGTRPAGP